jgi:predicted dehydrogenase
VTIASIGVGGRGSSLLRGFLARGDVECAYICDLDPARGGDCMKEVERRTGKKARRVLDYRRVFDDRGVDAVVVATPDHWHGPATVYACQAGKHVYVEKPPCHNIWEGRKMVEAARRYRRVVQVGTQNRSAPYNQKAVEYIRSGKLGKIHLCKVYNLKSGGPGGPFREPPDSKCPQGVDYDRWLGPAPLRPFNRAHWHGGWHHYWRYSGGDAADDGSHQIDLARWLIGKEYPKSVAGMGGRIAFPGDDGEVPDTQTATFEFDGLLMTFELAQWAPYMFKTPGRIRFGDEFPNWLQNATRIELYGTRGLMVVGRHGGGWQVFTQDARVVAKEPGRFPDDAHKENFIGAVRGQNPPSADIEEGHKSAILLHLANIAARLGGRRFAFDAKTETIPGDPGANALVKRVYRSPYTIPEAV